MGTPWNPLKDQMTKNLWSLLVFDMHINMNQEFRELLVCFGVDLTELNVEGKSFWRYLLTSRYKYYKFPYFIYYTPIPCGDYVLI